MENVDLTFIRTEITVNFRISISASTLLEFQLMDLLINHQIKPFTYYGDKNVVSHCLISGTQAKRQKMVSKLINPIIIKYYFMKCFACVCFVGF